jgi:prolyl oligopeptidase
LEDFSNAEVKKWADAQNASARQVLDKLPERPAIYQELVEWDQHRDPSYYDFVRREGKFFAMKMGPQYQHPVLVVMPSADRASEEGVLINPDVFDPHHGSAIDFFEPSLDGKYLAVSISSGGSERGDVRVFDATTGKATSDFVPGVNGGTAGGSVAWNADGSGFFYTRYPRGNERPEADHNFYQQVWFHKLGNKTEQDTYAIGKDFPRIAEILLQTSPDGRYISARVANGDGGDFEFFLHTPDGNWAQLATFADHVINMVFGMHDDAFLLSRNGAPRGKVLHLALNKPLSEAKVFSQQSDGVVENMVAVSTGLYVRELVGGPSRLRFLPLQGKPVTVPAPTVSSISDISRAGGSRALFRSTGYLLPPAWYIFDPATGKAAATKLKSTSPVPLDSYEVIRETATSKDGTKVPFTVVKAKKGPLDGSTPLVLTGYGGYGISETPEFSITRLQLLKRGISVAVANLRGGGEFGEEWHDEGRLTRKQNVFDDFAAVAQTLIDRKYTRREKLGIMGGSNGGLLMGAAFTQHPELFHTVVSFVGIYDMLRVELSPNGAFNVTEFGTVKEADQFRALYAYSPYHHVKNGVQYPAILFLTGDNDPRVDPMQSRKMTARLQASGTKQPVLLRTSSASGHGIGTAKNEAFAEAADALAFFCKELAN